MRKSPHGKASVPRLRANDRRIAAISMKRKGMSYRAIGKALGISGAAAHRTIMVALREAWEVRIKESTLMIEEQDARLDAIVRAMWPAVELGSTEAASIVLRAEADRRRLFGIEGAIKVDSKVYVRETDAMTDEELQSIAYPGITDGRDGAAVAQQAHNQQVSGSTPDLAPNATEP
jgi:hypothetical protein